MNINSQDKYGRTSLMLTSDPEFVKLLIRAGADLNIKSKHGCTALIIACQYEELEIAQLLIKAGANVNIRDNNGNTALMVNRNLEIARMLIVAGANIELKNKCKCKNCIKLINTIKQKCKF